MKRWMIDITFNQAPDAEFLARVPLEQQHVGNLREQGVIEALYLAADNRQVWLVMRAGSQAELEQQLTGFPLHRYFVSRLTELG